MQTSDFTNLTVWQKSIATVKHVYALVKLLPDEERYGLSDQMRRAAISIPSNIAEGHGRNSYKDFIRFLNISRGSVAELRTQLYLCPEIAGIEKDSCMEIINELKIIDKMLCGLIGSLEKRL